MSPSSVSSLMIGMKMMIAGTASTKSPTMMNSSTSRSMIMNAGRCRRSRRCSSATGVGPAQIGEHPAEGRRAGRRPSQRQRVEQAGVHEVARQLPDVAGSQDRDHHEEDVDRGDHAGLGRREPAGEDAAHDDDRDHHRQRPSRAPRRTPRQASRAASGADRPEEVAVDHQADADHHARHDAARGTARRSTRCRSRRRPPP